LSQGKFGADAAAVALFVALPASAFAPGQSIKQILSRMTAATAKVIDLKAKFEQRALVQTLADIVWLRLAEAPCRIALAICPTPCSSSKANTTLEDRIKPTRHPRRPII